MYVVCMFQAQIYQVCSIIVLYHLLKTLSFFFLLTVPLILRTSVLILWNKRLELIFLGCPHVCVCVSFMAYLMTTSSSDCQPLLVSRSLVHFVETLMMV